MGHRNQIRFESLFAWARLRTILEDGAEPTREHLADALRTHFGAIPADLAAYIADLIEGKKRRRGRPRQRAPFQERLIATGVRLRYEELLEKFSRQGRALRRGDLTPRARALHAVALELGASPRRVEAYLTASYRRRPRQ